MTEDIQFSVDEGTFTFHEDVEGIEHTDDGVTFDWDSIERVRIDDPVFAEQFDTNEFHKIPVTAARPIKQTYYVDGEKRTFVKPREELKKAAWSLDNRPYTLDHPETGMLKDVNDVHGFFKNPRYTDSLDNLDVDLHVPVDDEKAKRYIETSEDVSVGFYNRLVREYDGLVGNDLDDEDVDAYQTSIMFDHVASVQQGRCPGDKGCGIQAGQDGFKTPTDIIDEFENEQESTEDSSETKTMSENDDWKQFLDSMTVEAIMEENDAVKERVSELTEEVDELESEVESKEDELELLKDEKDELEQKIDEYEAEQKEELVSEILERTDRLGDEDELMDKSLEQLQDKHELVTSLTSEKDANPEEEIDEDNEPEDYGPTIIKAGTQEAE